MGEVLTIFIFFAVIAVTAVVFFGWVVYMVIRAGLGALHWLFAPTTGSGTTTFSPTVRCATRGCQAVNPATARFCRRCGRGLHADRLNVRRAAVW